jgi:hypothetical protein
MLQSCCSVTFYTNITSTKVAHSSKIHWHASFQHLKVNAAGVDPASQGSDNALVLLLTIYIGYKNDTVRCSPVAYRSYYVSVKIGQLGTNKHTRRLKREVERNTFDKTINGRKEEAITQNRRLLNAITGKYRQSITMYAAEQSNTKANKL